MNQWPAQPAGMRKKVLGVLAVGLVLGAAGFFFFRHVTPQATKDELLGVWKTDNPAYAGRFFEIRGDLIIIGLGNDSVSTQAITAIEARPDQGHTDYVIHTLAYDDETYTPEEGHETKWLFAYRPTDGGVIEFDHQPGKWKKVPDE